MPQSPNDLASAIVDDIYQAMSGRPPTRQQRERWTSLILVGRPMAEIRLAIRSEQSSPTVTPPGIAAQDPAELIAGSGLFDPDWYVARFDDVASAGVDPLNHYLEHGRQEGRAPNAWFDPPWYRATHGIPAGEDPLLHYIQYGEAHDLAPGPDFDPAWYRTAFQPSAPASPLAHFLLHRRSARVAPCARLWSLRGLPPKANLSAADDPFVAFLQAQPQNGWPPTTDIALIRSSGLFDDNFYVLHSSDVFDAQMDPLEHFCRFGWREGRDPNFYFRSRWYLETNADAVSLGVNPLAHYLLVGEAAGRRPAVYFDPIWYRSTYGINEPTSPLAHFLANRRGQTFSPNALFDPAWYLAHCGAQVHRRRDPFSHFLVAGMTHDVGPSEHFDMAAWRTTTRGRPSRHFKNLLSPEQDNPLVTYLLSIYR